MGMRITVVTALAGALLAGTAHGFDPSPPDGIGVGQRATKPCGEEQAGYCVVPRTQCQDGKELAVVPYYPRPGDIFLYDNGSKVLDLGFKLVGSGAPIHAAIVIAREDGTPAILEVGPNSQPHAFTKTYIVDVLSRLESYPGPILVRRCKKTITPEDSKALTCFAHASEGKEFAVGRLLLQATPCRCRSGLRRLLFAHTYLERRRWICSENVVAAATVAGILDPKEHPANAMYPRDLAFDEQYDLRGVYENAVLWVAKPQPQIDGNRVIIERQK